MSRWFAQVAALFVAPAIDAPTAKPPLGESEPPAHPTQWQPPVEATWDQPSEVGIPADDEGPAETRSTAVRPPGPVDAAVVGAGPDAVTLGATLAAELRCRNRARAALLLIWDPGGAAPAPMPAWAGARGLAATLGESHVCAARGRLVALQLPHEPLAAAATADSLAGDARVPAVLVLGGPRASAFHDLLGRLDILVVLEADGSPGSLTELAAAELRRLNPHVVVQSPLGGVGRRLLALSGLGRARSLGARLDEAVR